MKTPPLITRTVESYKLTAQLRALVSRVKELDQRYAQVCKPHPGFTRLSQHDFNALDRRIYQESGGKFTLSNCVLFSYPVIAEHDQPPVFALTPEAKVA